MISNVKLGAGLVAAIAGIALAVYTFSRPAADESASQLEVKKSQSSSKPSGAGSSTGATPAPDVAKVSPATPSAGDIASSGVASQSPLPASGALSPAQTRAQRAEQKLARAKALDVLSKIMSKGAAADPKEVKAALISLENTIPTPEGKKQLALSRRVYEHSLRIQDLAVELGAISRVNLPQNKQRQQEIIAEISTLQLETKNATDAARQYASEQLKAAR